MKKNEKLTKDLEVARPILERAMRGIEPTPMEKFQLIKMLCANMHTSGKIEGIFSIDSSASGCSFCAKMQEAAEKIGDDHICKHCYARKGRFLMEAVKDRHMLNMAILSIVEFEIIDFAPLGLSGFGRINADGDFENVTHVKNVLRIMYANPFGRFTVWTKNVADTIAATDEVGKPSNAIYVASSPIIGKAIALPKYFDYTFTVYRKDQIAKAIECGGMECNGKKCKECGFKCYKGEWKNGSNICEVLR